MHKLKYFVADLNIHSKNVQLSTRNTANMTYKETYFTNFSRARAYLCLFIVIKTKNGLLRTKYTFNLTIRGFTLIYYVVYVFYTDVNYAKGYDKCVVLLYSRKLLV